MWKFQAYLGVKISGLKFSGVKFFNPPNLAQFQPNLYVKILAWSHVKISGLKQVWFTCENRCDRFGTGGTKTVLKAGIKVLMRILVGHRTRPDHNLTIYDETKFSSCHTPYINSILHPASSYYFLSHKKLFQASNFNVNVRRDLLYFSIWGVYSKTYQKLNLWPMETA